MFRIKTLVTGLVTLASLALPCLANVVTNGSFENTSENVIGNTTGTTGLPGASGVTNLTSWTTVTSYASWYGEGQYGTFAWLVDDITTAKDGRYYVNISNYNDEGRASISQSFSVIVDQTYTVSYWEKYRDSSSKLYAIVTAASGTLTALTSTGIDATISGSGTAQISQLTGTPSVWAEYTFTFRASETTTVSLKFKNNSSWDVGSCDGTSLDSVIVTVPEPSTAVLMVSGLGGLLAYAWRKRQRS